MSFDDRIQQAYELQGKGELAEALAIWAVELALAEDPVERARATNGAGELVKQLGRTEDARRLLTPVVEGDAPRQQKIDAQYLIAHSFIDEGRRDLAPPAWRKLLELGIDWAHGRSEALAIVGEDLAERGEREEAIPLLQECGDLDGGAPWCRADALMALARIHAARGDRDRARAALERVPTIPELGEDHRRRAAEQLAAL